MTFGKMILWICFDWPIPSNFHLFLPFPANSTSFFKKSFRIEIRDFPALENDPAMMDDQPRPPSVCSQIHQVKKMTPTDEECIFDVCDLRRPLQD